MDKYFLGIDTSNYMSSICYINEDRQIIYEAKKLLDVKKGERGLQQSQALFQHIKNLPKLLYDIQNFEHKRLTAIAVSKSPRPQDNSYMPVFLAGTSIARSIAYTNQIPVYYTTHQEGHIVAGLHSLEEKISGNQFLAVHISGGTSEILHVEQSNNGYHLQQIGGSMDLHAGQLIDRIGVQLGFSFPAGKYLEQLAATSEKDFRRIPSFVHQFSFSFSGAEAEAFRRIKNQEPQEEIARAVEHVIAVTVEKALRKAVEANYSKDILIVGGVAQNEYIREYLMKRLEHRAVGAKLFFAHKNYSGDNAFGVANIALNQYIHNEKG